MASPPSVRRALKRLVENPKASCKARLHALTQLQSSGVHLAMLERLIRDSALPARLLAAVIEAYDAELTIRKRKHLQKAAAIPSVLGSW